MKNRLPKDNIALGISVLKLVGEFTSYKSKLPIKIYRFFNCVVIMLNVILLVANLSTADGYMYVQIIGSFGVFGHGLLRYICLLCYKPEIYSLLNDMEQFWNRKHVKYIYRMGKREYAFLIASPTMLVVLTILCIIIYSFKPLVTKGGLIFPTRIVVDSLSFQAALLFSQYYVLLIMITIVCGYDIIYISYCAQVIVQINTLRYRFEHITRNVDFKTIRSYIRHHQFMLKIFDRMKGIYFWMFFFLYGLTLLSGCSQLYIIILGDDFLGSAIYIIAVFVEFGLYTFIVEEVVSQFTDVTYSVYNSLWYERTLGDRKLLLFIMMKGQRQRYFSAGGLTEINVDTFGTMIRKIFSFYAILKNVLNK